MNRVLFCSQASIPVGGVQTGLDHLARELPRRGWDVVVALARGPRHHDPEAFRVAHPDLQTVELDGRSGTHDGRFVAVAGAVERVRPDVVVPVTLVDPFWVVAELRSRGVGPRLLFGLQELNPEILDDVRFFRPIIDRAVGVSRLTAELLVTVGGLERDRVDYVPNGVNAPTRLGAREPGAPLRLGMIGRFDKGKRPLDLIELCRQLDVRSVPFHVVAVGGGQHAEELACEARPWIERGVFEIQPAMPQDALYETVYPRIDACLLFSESEGLGNVPLEAMMHGVVPVVSDFTGRRTAGLLRPDETALVFPVGDVDAAADAVARLARDADLFRSLSMLGRRELEGWHRVADMAEGWALALHQALDGPPASGSGTFHGPRNGRLSRVLGRVAAERIRRVLGRRFIPDDASEWPYSRQVHRKAQDESLKAAITAAEAGGAASTWRPLGSTRERSAGELGPSEADRPAPLTSTCRG